MGETKDVDEEEAEEDGEAESGGSPRMERTSANSRDQS